MNLCGHIISQMVHIAMARSMILMTSIAELDCSMVADSQIHKMEDIGVQMKRKDGFAMETNRLMKNMIKNFVSIGI